MVKEADHEKELRKAVERAGGRCWKLPASIYRFIPDRLILLPRGRVFFRELKKDGEKATLGQIAMIKILQNMGFNAEIIHGKSGVKEFIDVHISQSVPTIDRSPQ
jgi:hypothetical protein